MFHLNVQDTNDNV